MPWVLSAFLFIAGVRIFVAELRAPQVCREIDADAAEDAIPRMHLVGPAVVGLLTVGFVAAFPHLGYASATLVYVFAIALFFNVEQTRRWGVSVVWAVLTAAGVTGFGWLFFVELFDLYLPGWSL